MKLEFDIGKAYLKRDTTGLILGYQGVGEDYLPQSALREYIVTVGPLIIPDFDLFLIAAKHLEYIDFEEL